MGSQRRASYVYYQIDIVSHNTNSQATSIMNIAYGPHLRLLQTGDNANSLSYHIFLISSEIEHFSNIYYPFVQFLFFELSLYIP